jgi:hypothetical protein
VTAGAVGQTAYRTTFHPYSYVWRPNRRPEPESADWSAVRFLGEHSVLVVDATRAVGTAPATLTCVATSGASNTEAGVTVDRFVIERRT